jgi:hypothetical protein
MRLQAPIGAHAVVGLILVALLATACDRGVPSEVEVAELQPQMLQSIVTTGNARLAVTVLKSDGTPAKGSIATVVLKPPVGASQTKAYGPIRHAEVGASGVVSWVDLPNNVSVCVHARSGVALSTARGVHLYPAPVGTLFDEPTGDPNQAAVVTGPNGTSEPLSRTAYLDNCVKTPPVALPGGRNWVDITLRHVRAHTIDVAVLDLLGVERRNVQRGVTLGGRIPGVSPSPVFNCDEIPWLADDPLCSEQTPPGFLQSHTQGNKLLSAVGGAPFRLESLHQILLAGKPVELVGTAGYRDELDAGETVILGGEQLVCDANNSANDAIGDAAVLDIQGKVKYSIGVDYGVDLKPDPTVAVIWFAMTPEPGSMRYSSRTILEGQNATRSFNADITVGPDAEGKYRCQVDRVWGSAADLGQSVEVHCGLPAGSALARVTLIQRGLSPWALFEFNVRTSGAGSGDSTEDPSRSGASRAWISIPNSGECTVLGGNDDRVAIRI